MVLDGKDVGYLKKLDGNCFKLIKKLWEAASDPSQRDIINSKYGVENISYALTFNDAYAVKGATSVLLFLSLSFVDDFESDVFYNNYYKAVGNPQNESNVVILARLLRLLQIDKNFGDWMLSKGPSPRENLVWRRLYDLSKIEELGEEIRKETSRAVKEGMRVGAKEGQFCTIPERVIRKMKNDTFWKIKDADIDKLSDLSSRRGGVSSFRTEKNNELTAYLERKLQEEQANTRRVKNELEQLNDEIAAARSELKAMESNLTNPQPRLKDSAVKDADAKWGRDALLKSITSLSDELHQFKENNTDANKDQEDLQAQMLALREDIETLHTDVCKSVADGLRETQTEVIAALRRAQAAGTFGEAAMDSALGLAPQGQGQGQGVLGQGQGWTMSQGPSISQSMDLNFGPSLASPSQPYSLPPSQSQSPSLGQSLTQTLSRNRYPGPNPSMGALSPSASPTSGRPAQLQLPASPSSREYLGGTTRSFSSTQKVPPPSSDDLPLPPGWEKKLDVNTNRYYYFQRSTKLTQWRPPI